MNTQPSLFTPGCPCCAEELGLGGIPAASGSRHRHPASDPRERGRKELTQCQQCWRSKAPGVTPFRCTGCKVDLYCSKECQKKAWPSHKTKCRLNQRTQEMPEMNLQSLQLLRAFTSKHRPTIAEAGVRSLDLYSDPSRAKNYILMVFLRSRPESKRTETAFYATGADVVSFDFFPQEKREEMQQQLQFAHNQNVRSGHGMIGTLWLPLETGRKRC
ncbi:unnamed protein product [Somion occarium]|uniref:MYND-type domain-containing protein n=1 Tax=Somion occarium TaxID=3059160 RepID=A0ABP1DNL6_9APHY